MVELTVTKKRELVFRINSPILQPNGTATHNTEFGENDSAWKITLTRRKDILTVTVTWSTSHGCGQCRDSAYCNSCRKYSGHMLPHSTMHIIPCKKTSAFSSKPADASEYRSSPVKCDIKHANVVFKGEYWFDIVLSYGDSLPVLPVEPLENAPKNRDTMLTLLKDINSVDTCFVFESDKSYSNVGLWAHRVILAKYKKFDEIIQDASKKAAAALSEKADAGCDTTESSTPTAGRDENPTVLTIPVPKDFSLSTLSVLLRYIYTGEIKLIADLGQHAVSMTKSSLVIYDAMGKTRESIRWSPFDADSPWKLKDVTWEELLLAADHFGVSDMRKNCEDEVIGAMNQSNVVDTLFNIGCSFDTVKKAALDFIVENMETMMLDGQDPFVAFKNHPDCHSLMFEVMCRRVKKA